MALNKNEFEKFINYIKVLNLSRYYFTIWKFHN
jgi:hypothetical protein